MHSPITIIPYNIRKAMVEKKAAGKELGKWPWSHVADSVSSDSMITKSHPFYTVVSYHRLPASDFPTGNSNSIFFCICIVKASP